MIMQKRLRGMILGVVMSFAAYAAYAENITVSTFYPSPFGSYQSLTTTNVTNLATTAGNVVIGAAGAGTSKLDVTGTGNTTVDLKVNGRMQTGDGNNNGGVWLGSAQDGLVGNTGANIGFWTSGAGVGWNALQIVKATGNVSIGGAPTAYKLDVNGTVHVGSAGTPGSITVTALDGGVSRTGPMKVAWSNDAGGGSWYAAYA